MHGIQIVLGSSEDIPTEQIEELVLFSQFGDAPIPKPRDGHVISGHWRRTRSRAPTPVDSERPIETSLSLLYTRSVCVLAVHYIVACLHSFEHRIDG